MDDREETSSGRTIHTAVFSSLPTRWCWNSAVISTYQWGICRRTQRCSAAISSLLDISRNTVMCSGAPRVNDLTWAARRLMTIGRSLNLGFLPPDINYRYIFYVVFISLKTLYLSITSILIYILEARCTRTGDPYYWRPLILYCIFYPILFIILITYSILFHDLFINFYYPLIYYFTYTR